MQLVIVESPTKAKTISKFLGKDYKIESSFGHIRDLPSSVLGVDTEKDFQLKYVIPLKAKPKVKILKEAAKKAENVILATDEDREGEAISWHLSEVLGLKAPQRIVFHEITKSAIEEALKHPRDIDMDLVDAQQARRALDRLVGYKLSPFLWKKLMRGLSAGRVQSVAVRLICDREKEIEKFIPVEYWSIVASLLKLKSKNENLKSEFEAILIAKDDKTIDKLEVKNKQEADQILQDLENAEYKVISVDKKETKRNPLAPFTTSTLQQTASAKLGYGAQRTMSIAQKLYEKGHITYHRTDSMNLSSISQATAKSFIENAFGKNYWPGYSRSFKTKSKSAQEAHEAIRPTAPNNSPEQIKKSAKFSPDESRLYNLIWKRFMASQMTEACFDATSIDIESKCQNIKISKYLFRANGQVLKFDGFLKIYPMKFEEADLPTLKKDEILELKELLSNQHFTQPPARYSEATLIKALEKDGIGRPSTYAPIISTIQNRNYVEKDENKKLKPTKIGIMVNDILVEHFPDIVDTGFTAEMEEKLDKVAEGKQKWVEAIKNFYVPFEKNLLIKEKTVEKRDLTEKTDKICPECQGPMIIRLGRFGRFYACSKFPNCKHTEALPKPSLNIECPKCGQGQIVEKKSKRGKMFYGCANWPHCDFALWDKPVNQKCPHCGDLMVETKSQKIRCSNKNCLQNERLKTKR